MSFGMSADEFWHGDPWLAVAYRKADEYRVSRADEMAWLQGRYVYEAIVDLAPIFNPFSKKQPRDYPDMPYLAKDRERRDKEKKREHDMQYMHIQAMNFAKTIDRWMAEHGEASDG